MLTGFGWRRIFLYRQGCDLRRSFDRLAVLVREELREDPLSGDLYMFINRRGMMIKALYWDSDGYALWQKRLERGRFSMPEGDGSRIGRVELMHILEGVKVSGLKRLPRYKYPFKPS